MARAYVALFGYCRMFALGTVVRFAYRRQGLAMVLKVQSIAYALRHGHWAAITCTANPTMLTLNEKLGYRHDLAEVRLIKIVRGSGG